MVKLAAKDINANITKLNPLYHAVLVFGSDEGQVRETSKKLATQVVEDLNDPFNMVKPSAQAIADDPALLCDELNAMSMMGGRRVIWLDLCNERTSTTLNDAVKNAVESQQGDNLLIVSADNLKADNAIRKFFEKSKVAAAMARYPDEGRDIGTLITEVMNAHSLQIDNDARGFLCSVLGNDRAISRGEVEKLALYKGVGNGSITIDDVKAVVGDNAAFSLDQIADSVLSGRVESLDTLLDRADVNGEAGVAVLFSIRYRLLRLHYVKGLIEEGVSPDSAIKKLRPMLFWKDKDSFMGQLRNWSRLQLSDLLEQMTDVEFQCKSTGFPVETITKRFCLSTAVRARHNARRN